MAETTTFISFNAEMVRDEIVEAALATYLQSGAAPIDHQLAIRQYQYAQSHDVRDLVATADHDAGTLNIGLLTADRGDDYTATLPLTDHDTTASFMSGTEVAITDATLIAARFDMGFPYEHEIAVGYYDATLANPAEATESLRETPVVFTRQTRIRDAPADEHASDRWIDTYRIDNLTELTRAYSPPNPWAYDATAVLYEDTPLAQDVLQRSKWTTHEGYDIRVTYPDRVTDGEQSA